MKYLSFFAFLMIFSSAFAQQSKQAVTTKFGSASVMSTSKPTGQTTQASLQTQTVYGEEISQSLTLTPQKQRLLQQQSEQLSNALSQHASFVKANPTQNGELIGSNAIYTCSYQLATNQSYVTKVCYSPSGNMVSLALKERLPGKTKAFKNWVIIPENPEQNVYAGKAVSQLSETELRKSFETLQNLLNTTNNFFIENGWTQATPSTLQQSQMSTQSGSH